MTDELQPGALVLGPFYSDGREGAGVIVARDRNVWTRVPQEYVPVRILAGDRASGGYRPEHLRHIGEVVA